MLFKTCVWEICFLLKENCAPHKYLLTGPLIVTLFFQPFAARLCSKMAQGLVFRFWGTENGSLALLRIRRPMWGRTVCCQRLWCCLCLWRVPWSVKCVFMICFALCLRVVRCGPPTAATTVSSLTSAGPQSSCCPCFGLPNFRWRRVLLLVNTCVFRQMMLWCMELVP